MDAKRGSTSTKTYTVSGKTLADINKDMMQKGPPDPNEGRKYSGSCKGTIALAIAPNDFAFETTPGSSPVEVTATLKGGSVTSSAEITMPKLASESGLSPAAVKEWRRFLVAVGNHERGHSDSYYALAVSLAKDIAAMSSTGTGKDEHAARLASNKAFVDELTKQYGGSVLSDLVKKDAAAYDAKTKHGASQGAVLDTSIT